MYERSYVDVFSVVSGGVWAEHGDSYSAQNNTSSNNDMQERNAKQCCNTSYNEIQKLSDR